MPTANHLKIRIYKL